MKYWRVPWIIGLFWCGTVASAQEVYEPLKVLREVPKLQRLNIKPKPLADALTEWAERTGMQVVVPESMQAEQMSRHIRGKLTAQEALDQLLLNTGLYAEMINERTVSIKGGKEPARPAKPKPASDSASTKSEEITVTGSRLRGDIRADGSLEIHAPITVIDRKQIDAMGISIAPQMQRFISQQPYGPVAEAASTGNAAQYAELRGLGRDTTLVLINGRRTVPSSTSITSNAFDLNTLPLAAVERVEVLSDSAAAVYGTDAVGGVMNFILKKDISRPTLDFNYGMARGGAEERQVTFSTGYSSERLRATTVLDYQERGTLLGEERDLWRNQDYRRFGGKDYRAFTTNPGNVYSLTAENLPGLPSTFAAVPEGSTGIGLTPADFLPTAGQRNSDSLFRYWSIVAAVQRRSVMASVDFDVTPAVSVFGECLYIDDRRNSNAPPNTSRLTVPADNPFNPFGVAVSVDYLFSGLTPTNHNKAQRYRALTGVRGTLRDWDWELSLLRISDDGSAWVENEVDIAKVTAALSATDPAQALNVFKDGSGGDAALLASLVAAPSPDTFASKSMQPAGVLRGQLFTLPAGDADMVLGGEWLESDMLVDTSDAFMSAHRSVAAAFAELRLPLVSPAMQVPAVQKLSVTMAGRYDHYTDFGSTFNPQYGLHWTPAANTTLRASYGTSFRAPSLWELHGWRGTLSGVTIADPLRNNEVTPVDFLGGSNPDLEPIESDSLTAGFDFAPSSWKGMQFSGTYWRIDMDNRVSVLSPNTLAKNWELFPERVTRAERTAADIAAGLPGKLIFIDQTRMNFGTLQTSGIDLGVAQTINTRTGEFSARLSATWIEKYVTEDVPGVPATNRLGVASVWGTIPRWRAVATLGWNRHGMSLSATGRYTHGYADVNALGRLTGRIIPSQTLIDLQGSLDFDRLLGRLPSWSPGLKLTAGVSNVFDQEPHFAEVYSSYGYDVSQGDLKQRFGYLKLSAQF